LAGLFSLFVSAAPARADRDERVLLVHGLGRGPASLTLLEHDLRAQGYQVVNLRYPSQSAPITELAEHTFASVFQADAAADSPRRVHVVTHSLGGILLRRYLHDHGVPERLGRVVMLAPPNQGSEIVDLLSRSRLYRRLNGPAGSDLGTSSNHAPRSLGPLPGGVEVGVIAGSFSWNPLFSALIPGPDDGKVSVARTHLVGEADHLTLPYSHTWLMNRRETRRQVAAFLDRGRFAPLPSRATQQPTREPEA
jgi:pimeloyl-ACP methyl ester carboxylesterase